MLQRILLSILCACLMGCALFETQEAAPVVDPQSLAPVVQGVHTVQPGESLYAIAWRYGRDYRDIASANHISSPYKIYPGQKLTLQKPRHFQDRQSLPKKPATFPAKTVGSYTPAPLAKKEEGAQLVASKKTIPLTPNTNQSLEAKPQPKEKNELKGLNSVSQWDWPVRGKITKAFSVQSSGALNKGIDIAGTLGTPIKAARGGKVVYSGTGLRGYGQLIIIKHNDTFLSAYAHNSAILVKEGDSVKQGQIIAKMGKTDADHVKLHFEIRKNGQPINPLDFLSAG